MDDKTFKTSVAVQSPLVPVAPRALLSELRGLIASARERLAVSVNAELSLLYWNVGQRINRHVLGNKRAEYGAHVIEGLSQKLCGEFGSGWGTRQLLFCSQFASSFPDPKIVNTLCSQLSWSHIKVLIGQPDPLKREFYAEMCKIEHWSVRTLRGRIDAMMYERTAVAKKPREVIKKDLAQLRDEKKMSPDLAFRDPYFLNFLGLAGAYSEKDLEKAMVADMKNSIIELGGDMAFVAEQKMIPIDNEEYWLDLLFYHRRLRRLIAIDLKLGSFKAEYKGQMELYLRWLDKCAKCPGEKTPLGLVLCAGKNDEHVKLLELEKSNIRVATYLTELPPRKVLEAKLRQAIEIAKARIDEKEAE